ncbi:MAG TPA: ABC transporter permease [Noviherbaspirillum sp.]
MPRHATRHPFFESIAREWGLLCQRPWDLAMISWVPLLSAALIFAIFSAGIPTRLPVGVRDADHSALSRQLVRFLDATPGLQVVQQVDDELAAERAMRSGAVYGMVEVPAGFARDIKLGHAAQITLLHNAQFSSHSGMIQRDVRTATGTLSAGIEIVARNKRGESPRAARLSQEPIRTAMANLFNPALDYLQFLGMALVPAMLHIFAMVAGAWSVGTELRDGTLGEWKVICVGGRQYGGLLLALLGKLVPSFIALFAVGIASTLGFMAAGGWHPAGSMTLALLALGAMIGLSIALGALAAAISRSLRTALSATGFITAPAFAFSGAAFPIAAMPQTAQWWAMSLPFTHYLRVQIEQLEMGVPVSCSAGTVGVMLLAAVVALAIAAHCIGKAAADPSSWGKR